MEANCFISDTDDFDQYIEGLLAGKRPSQATIAKICQKVKEVLAEEPNVVSLQAPMTICGNVSGELENLLEIFHLVGKPPENNFLFLGNYFHRGPFGVETFSLLLALKVRYKNRITLLRGMGDDRQHSQAYGFYDECGRKYGNSDVWRLFADVFNYLPLCAVVDESYFCLAGGLTPLISNIEEIQELDRFGYDSQTQIPVLSMIWSDPRPNDAQGWANNHRGLGYYFPNEESKRFLYVNKLKLICRLGQVEIEGYSYKHDNMVLSICSSPNFLDQCGNHGAIVEIDESSQINILQFYCKRIRQAPIRNLDYFSNQNIGFHDKLLANKEKDDVK